MRVRRFSKFKLFRLARKTIPALGVQGITDFISGFLINIQLLDAVSIAFRVSVSSGCLLCSQRPVVFFVISPAENLW